MPCLPAKAVLFWLIEARSASKGDDPDVHERAGKGAAAAWKQGLTARAHALFSNRAVELHSLIYDTPAAVNSRHAVSLFLKSAIQPSGKWDVGFS